MTDLEDAIHKQYAADLRSRRVVNHSSILVCCWCGQDIVGTPFVVLTSGPEAGLAMHPGCKRSP